MSDDNSEIQMLIDEFSEFVVDIREFEKDKLIGKGGYSEVWHAINRKTGQKVALKQLLPSVTNKQARQFAREIRTMAYADHPFFLKCLGFSTRQPLTLVMEYIPNGSLFRYLRSDRRREMLKGTQRTLIAMGVAHAMAYLHSLGIIHRDLKSMNILLDETFLPKLCDFGIARFLDSDQVMTVQVGTPHWMAPEILNGKKYGTEVDVYSFGMLLYELATNTIPWDKLDPPTLINLVCLKHARPIIPQETPENLKNLIKLCWSQHPHKRPTFAGIYHLFKTGQVEFEGTDPKMVSKFGQMLHKYHIKSKGEMPSHIPPSSPPEESSSEILEEDTADVPLLTNDKNIVFSSGDNAPFIPDIDINDFREQNNAFISKYNSAVSRKHSDEFKSKRGARTLKDKSLVNLAIIKDPTHYSFKIEMKKATQKLHRIQVNDFFSTIAKSFNNSTSTVNLAFILESLRKILTTEYAVNAFAASEIHKMLPINRPELIDICFNILHYLFKQHPTIFQDYNEIMQKLITISPLKSLNLLALFSMQYLDMQNVSLLELLFTEQNSFLDPKSSGEYIRLIYYLFDNYEAFYQQHMNQCLDVLHQCLSHTDEETVKQSYYALLGLEETSYELDADIVVNHLKCQKTAEPALIYMLQAKRISRKSSIITALISVIAKYPYACNILIRIASKEEGALLLTRDATWMDIAMPTWPSTFQIFLMIFSHETCRKPLISHPQSLKLFKNLVNEKDSVVLFAISEVLINSELDEDIVSKFIKQKFLKSVITSSLEIDDKLGYQSVFSIITSFAPFTITEDCLLLLPPAKKFLSSEPEFIIPIIQKLTKYPAYAAKMSELNLIPNK